MKKFSILALLLTGIITSGIAQRPQSNSRPMPSHSGQTVTRSAAPQRTAPQATVRTSSTPSRSYSAPSSGSVNRAPVSASRPTQSYQGGGGNTRPATVNQAPPRNTGSQFNSTPTQSRPTYSGGQTSGNTSPNYAQPRNQGYSNQTQTPPTRTGYNTAPTRTNSSTFNGNSYSGPTQTSPRGNNNNQTISGGNYAGPGQTTPRNNPSQSYSTTPRTTTTTQGTPRGTTGNSFNTTPRSDYGYTQPRGTTNGTITTAPRGNALTDGSGGSTTPTRGGNNGTVSNNNGGTRGGTMVICVNMNQATGLGTTMVIDESQWPHYQAMGASPTPCRNLPAGNVVAGGSQNTGVRPPVSASGGSGGGHIAGHQTATGQSGTVIDHGSGNPGVTVHNGSGNVAPGSIADNHGHGNGGYNTGGNNGGNNGGGYGHGHNGGYVTGNAGCSSHGWTGGYVSTGGYYNNGYGGSCPSGGWMTSYGYYNTVSYNYCPQVFYGYGCPAPSNGWIYYRDYSRDCNSCNQYYYVPCRQLVWERGNRRVRIEHSDCGTFHWKIIERRVWNPGYWAMGGAYGRTWVSAGWSWRVIREYQVYHGPNCEICYGNWWYF
ncbi:MAG: hypothetical protein H6581_31435 [Bacteroidia bacterium]|nr:hypothetical protein [Bacteroidia bacterium]